MEQKSTYSFVLKCKFSQIYTENELNILFTTINELFKGYNSFADKNEEYVFPKMLFSFKSDGKIITVRADIGYSENQEKIFDKLLKNEKEKLQKTNKELEAKKHELEIDIQREKDKLQEEWEELNKELLDD